MVESNPVPIWSCIAWSAALYAVSISVTDAFVARTTPPTVTSWPETVIPFNKVAWSDVTSAISDKFNVTVGPDIPLILVIIPAATYNFT